MQVSFPKSLKVLALAFGLGFVLPMVPAHAGIIGTQTQQEIEQDALQANIPAKFVSWTQTTLRDQLFETVARQEAEAQRAREAERSHQLVARSEAGDSGTSARCAGSNSVSCNPPNPSASGHDPCAEPISGLLPDYIVNRESHHQCDAYNHGGCGGRGCLGWAQIDEGHFSANSPWGNGPGSCYGLSYNGCVAKLSNNGTNLAPWKCC